MDKNSNTYIFLFAIIMIVIVAVVLSVISTQLQPLQDKNVKVQKMQDILAAMRIETTAEEAVDDYETYIINSMVVNSQGETIDSVKAFNVDMKKELAKPLEKRNLPLYIGKNQKGETKYVIPLRGKGLWGPIWGYIALSDDYNTVYGASFSHDAETPGLGAEIKTPAFENQFCNKEILDENGEFVSVDVIKGGAPDDDVNAVDAITGGTITSHGLRDMLKNCIKPYMSYFDKQTSKPIGE
ncbi:MAG: NADH:ubiquinone reductase (Na(+)-transporting) subunit C [Bacteroidota bacterium]|nr:NADH:ubiquinone reductase (Na(+)-transporting) subunit C [Bacteroidota bacterium]